MQRVALILQEIYNHFLPLAQAKEICLDLDLIAPDTVTAELEALQTDIEQALSAAIDRAPKGKILVQLTHHQIIITDTGTTLSSTACALLSTKNITVKSRPGFGTKVTINFQ